MTKLIWEDPPTRQQNRKGGYYKKFMQLIENPGKWARITTKSVNVANSTATALKSGRLPLPEDASKFEIVSRRTEASAKKSAIYARYVGTKAKLTKAEQAQLSKVKLKPKLKK